ncbi:hypothetical protein Acr_00g0030240 [Actinidia rufa]|uniref:Uncharacterized protein n=1 Tax=Actinidia rufa TaxID=165716 RepID=A0A7J0DEU6_9ERIC|nr:hypothetical protein Acr_00g0030240 [Actinidia rufa]
MRTTTFPFVFQTNVWLDVPAIPSLDRLWLGACRYALIVVSVSRLLTPPCPYGVADVTKALAQTVPLFGIAPSSSVEDLRARRSQQLGGDHCPSKAGIPSNVNRTPEKVIPYSAVSVRDLPGHRFGFRQLFPELIPRMTAFGHSRGITEVYPNKFNNKFKLRSDACKDLGMAELHNMRPSVLRCLNASSSRYSSPDRIDDEEVEEAVDIEATDLAEEVRRTIAEEPRERSTEEIRADDGGDVDQNSPPRNSTSALCFDSLLMQSILFQFGGFGLSVPSFWQSVPWQDLWVRDRSPLSLAFPSATLTKNTKDYYRVRNSLRARLTPHPISGKRATALLLHGFGNFFLRSCWCLELLSSSDWVGSIEEVVAAALESVAPGAVYKLYHHCSQVADSVS